MARGLAFSPVIITCVPGKGRKKKGVPQEEQLANLSYVFLTFVKSARLCDLAFSATHWLVSVSKRWCVCISTGARMARTPSFATARSYVDTGARLCNQTRSKTPLLEFSNASLMGTVLAKNVRTQFFLRARNNFWVWHGVCFHHPRRHFPWCQ